MRRIEYTLRLCSEMAIRVARRCHKYPSSTDAHGYLAREAFVRSVSNILFRLGLYSQTNVTLIVPSTVAFVQR